METIRVNMTPCEDIKTIHASQNDNEAREWGFELHNNGEKIDSSSISDQMVFKAYEGGTEEILPTNGSTPTTSPFKGDIKYPQGLLSDQEFLYRESPTEKDGLAKITDIKGNTLVWNQLVPTANKDFTSTNTDTRSFLLICRQSVSPYTELLNKSNVSVGILTAILQPTFTGSIQIIHSGQQRNLNILMSNIVSVVSGHKYLLSMNVVGVDTSVVGGLSTKDLMIFDLTQMGLDSITDPSEFTSLFPLSYYDYNQGTLLSFNGNSIKTVSKNQFDTSVVTTSYAGLTLTKTQGTIRAVYSGGSRYAGFNFYGSPVFTDTFLKGKYRLSFDVKGLDTQWTVGLRQGASFLGGGQTLAISNDGHYSFTIDAEANPNCYLSFARTGNKTTAYDVTFSNIQLELGTTETPYTPFEEQTISLPISQYFPWGMDGVGTAYDELTNSGYVKRMGMVDLGTQSWRAYTDVTTRKIYYATISGMDSTSAQIASSGLTAVPWGALPSMAEKTIQAHPSLSIVYACDSSCEDATEFTSAMSGVYLCFELNTPLENYGVVDLGSLTWTYQSANTRFYATIDNMPLKPVRTMTLPNPLYNSLIGGSISSSTDKVIYNGGNERRIYIHDLSYTSAEDFKQAMQGVYLLYEKENPQGFTTASLVTENAETPLSNEDGTLIGKCTEELSAEPGFHDAKIKLSDSDGTCYSNKIQLHIERKPS